MNGTPFLCRTHASGVRDITKECKFKINTVWNLTCRELAVYVSLASRRRRRVILVFCNKLSMLGMQGTSCKTKTASTRFHRKLKFY
jgi:hypothetical protein